MIYSFITDKNLDGVLKEYFRNQVINDRLHQLIDAEAAAFELIKSKLNARYDLVKLFPPIKEWTDTSTFLTGEYTSVDDVIYKAIADSNNHQLPVNNIQFIKSDPRNALLVRYCAIITVYFLLESINPGKISQQLIDDEDKAQRWLNQVKNSVEHPDFPLITIPGGMEVQGGSNCPTTHSF